MSELSEQEARESEPMLKWFSYEHLPTPLATVSKPFGVLAMRLVLTIEQSPERTVSLRKLLESKDAAVRARSATL